MERSKKHDLLLRSLALKHKLKVHDSLPRPDTHEEITINELARWELEDELHAIEAILRDIRLASVQEKRQTIEKKGVKKKSKNK